MYVIMVSKGSTSKIFVFLSCGQVDFFFDLSAPLTFHLMKMNLLKYLAKIYEVMCSVLNEKSSLKIISHCSPHL